VVVAPWLDVAESYIGLREIKGVGHNPTILGWLRSFALNIGRWGKSRDETPWCAVFVSHCLETTGYQSTRDARAVSYATYGKPSKFIQGAVIVIRRRGSAGADKKTGSRAGFHVGFFVRASKTHLLIVGGNQRNKVSRVWYSKAKYDVKALRWPSPTVA
jgi:uncharacterized protein (TIGR02594 family)